MAVFSKREGLEFEGSIVSDTAPLYKLVRAMLEAGEIHALRDPTRGGLRRHCVKSQSRRELAWN